MSEQWTLILSDGTRHEMNTNIKFEVLGGTKVIAASSTIDGDPSALSQAFTEGETLLETPNGHRHRVAVQMIRGNWTVTGLGG